eukprot:COSAG01_NODE_3099_length_6589_cov_2.308783_3_plen_155_part_00
MRSARWATSGGTVSARWLFFGFVGGLIMAGWQRLAAAEADTESGTSGCNGARGSSEGYEQQDAALFFGDFKSEYLMVDSCGIQARPPPEGPPADWAPCPANAPGCGPRQAQAQVFTSPVPFAFTIVNGAIALRRPVLAGADRCHTCPHMHDSGR